MAQATTKPAVTETVPKVWPGAFGAYQHSKLAIQTNLGSFIGLIALTIVTSLIPSFFTNKDGDVNPLAIIMQLLSSALSILLSGAITYLMIKNVKREKTELNEALNAGVNKFVPFLLQCFLMGLILVVSLLFFIVPFFFVMPRLYLAPYYLFDRDLSAVDSLKASWEETKGHAGKVWGILGLNLLIALLVVTIVGIPFAIYFAVMYSAADAVLYFWRKDHAKAASKQMGPILNAKA